MDEVSVQGRAGRILWEAGDLSRGLSLNAALIPLLPAQLEPSSQSPLHPDPDQVLRGRAVPTARSLSPLLCWGTQPLKCLLT